MSAAEPEPTVNIFGAPLSTAGMLLSTSIPTVPLGAFYVPLGVTVAVTAEWGITAELSGAYVFDRYQAEAGWAFSASAGPTWFLSGRGMGGFFFTPKFSFQMGRAVSILILADSFGGAGPIDVGPNVSRAFLVGADVGYQLRRGRFTVAFVLGASAGYAFDQQSAFTTPFEVQSRFSDGRTQGYAYALNLNFLRLGYAF
jgi:hypothetical protein